MTTNCPVIDDGYRDDEMPDRAVPDFDWSPGASMSDLSGPEPGRQRSGSVGATQQEDQQNQNESPYEAASTRFSAMMSALGHFATSELEGRQATLPKIHVSTDGMTEKEAMEAAGEAENMLHGDFYNKFGDLFDDQDLN
ncbi:hypothetical protein TKK_0016446 [Trichogramma kaykai]